MFRKGRRGITLLALLALTLALAATGIVLLSPASDSREPGPGAIARAKTAYADRDFETAEKLIAPIHSPEADILRAKIRRETGRLSEARDLFIQYPNDPEAVQGLAQCYTGLRQDTFAIAAWQKLTTLRPDDAYAWRELALAQARAKDMIGAMTSIQESLRLSPDQEDLHLLMNEAAMGKLDFEPPQPTTQVRRNSLPDPYRDHLPRPDWRNR